MSMIKRISLLLLLCVCNTVQADSVTYTYDALNRLEKAEYGGTAYAEYVYDDTGNMTRKTFYETALLVRLAEFTAEMSGGCAILTWKTLSEPDNSGFHILRSRTENGEYIRITEYMIAAEGEATRGAVYSYRDCDVNMGQTYYYRLEDVDYKGVSRYGRPVSPSETSDGVNTPYLSGVIRILQINAGMKLNAPVNLKTDDGKAGMEDAVYMLQVISGLRDGR